MPNSVWDAIHKMCDAIRDLPDADAPSALFNQLDIDRGRYDATLPIGNKLNEVLEFLAPLESVGSEELPTLPSAIAESLVTQLGLIAGIVERVPIKCKRWPETTGTIPPSFGPGEINAFARTVDAAYGQIYPQLKPIRDVALQAQQSSDDSANVQNVDARVDGVTSGATVESERVVFPLHGIRTRADWQKAFADVAQDQGWKCRLNKWNFGRMSLPSFLLRFGRSQKIKWFERTYTDEINDRNLDLKADERPSVVAHSFGTYIVGWAMFKYEELKFNKIILCGSILPTNFPWNELLERGQVRSVRNEYGVQDIWVKWVRFFVPKTGSFGSVGFSCEHARLEQKRFEFQHSDYFREGHMRAFWMPFLNRKDPAVPERQLSVKIPRSRSPIALYIAFVFLLLFFVGILAGPLRRPLTTAVRFFAEHFTTSSSSSSPASEEVVSSIGLKLHWVEPLQLWVGQYEVTQAEFRNVMGVNLSKYRDDNRTADKICLNDAKEFCRRLTLKDRNAGVIKSNISYRLPSESEFEVYFDGANVNEAVISLLEGQHGTKPVGSFAPNRYGLYDVLGNVWEWMENGTLRGACWDTAEWRDTQVGYRLVPNPLYDCQNFGFRCVLARSHE
jgi:pimeloyl-ACP methyl ester carboxylesterase